MLRCNALTKPKLCMLLNNLQMWNFALLLATTCFEAYQFPQLSVILNGKKTNIVTVHTPGNILVNKLIELDQPYTVVSGANACLNAFVLSGYQPPFTYVGFLPEKNKDRQALMQQLPLQGVLIFYVSVHDLEEVRQYLLEQLGDRKCCLIKELTKLHERVTHTTLSQPFEDNRGEFVLVVDRAEVQNQMLDLSVEQHVKTLIEQGLSKNEAIKTVAKQRKVNKNEIYKLFVNDIDD